MILFKQIFSAVAGILLLFSVSGGELDDLSRELDYIEYGFAFAAMQPASSHNRLVFKKRLMNFNSRMNQFYQRLRKHNVPRIPNFLKPSADLVRIFDALSNNSGYNRLPRFKGTSLGHYSRTYNQYLRDINRLEGKKSRGGRKPPILKTLPLKNYQVWLERTAQTYIQSLERLKDNSTRGKRSGYRKKRKSRRNNLDTNTINLLEEYITNVAQLRYCIAHIAQNKFYKE